jgi:hypothetical protein
MFQDMVNVGCNVIIGNGSDTSIWHDRWIEEASLATLFPSLYKLWFQKEASVQEVWNGTSLHLTFTRGKAAKGCRMD